MADVPDTPAEASEGAARDHVSEIVWDSLEAPDPGCLLCQEASRLGVWQEWGFDDPLAVGTEGE